MRLRYKISLKSALEMIYDVPEQVRCQDKGPKPFNFSSGKS